MPRVISMLDRSLWRKLSRGPQVILLKDAALMSAFTGLQSGDKAVDAGAGSGWLAIYLGSIVAPGGKVISYEWREDFAALAERNVKKAGLEGVVEIRRKDIFAGIDETDANLVTLDFAESDRAVAHAFGALRPGGWCVGYHPNVEQVKAFVEAAKAAGFEHAQTVESMVRELLVRPQGCRPQTTGLTHTGYLTFLWKPSGHAGAALETDKNAGNPLLA